MTQWQKDNSRDEAGAKREMLAKVNSGSMRSRDYTMIFVSRGIRLRSGSFLVGGSMPLTFISLWFGDSFFGSLKRIAKERET